MNQDILTLYKKAQNGGLNAQEVFWLEGQAAAHPCFGMAYMILARHHYRNQSTIKNRALLKAAAYANSRSLLRNYLEDTLTPPKAKPVPISEMKPILEKKDIEAVTINLHKQDQHFEVNSTPIDKGVPEPVLESISEEIEPATPVDVTAAQPIAESPAVDFPILVSNLISESEQDSESILSVIDSPELEAEVTEMPVDQASPIEEAIVVENMPPLSLSQENTTSLPTETFLEPAIAAQIATIVAEPLAVTFAGKPGEVNWFLNMRLRLRTDKFKGKSPHIAASIERFAATLATHVAEIEAANTIENLSERNSDVAIVVQNEDASPILESAMAVIEKTPPVIETENAIVGEEVEPAKADSADVNAITVPQDENSGHVVEHEKAVLVVDIESISVVTEGAGILEQEVVTPRRPAFTPKSKEKIEAPKPEKQYEIGAFSSFTFLPEGAADEVEDEIDMGIATMDAVEFKIAEGEHGSGEIIFEENDRIIEISVSPEALNKYFKGRLPSEPSPAFGEFRIELDENSYNAPETAVALDVDLVQIKDMESTAAPITAAEGAGLTFEPLDRLEDTPPALLKEKIDAIIDRFIENEPGITRAKVTGIPQGDLSKDSNKAAEDEWVTETLAKIYEKQGNKSKAIKIYERLRLRFPDKNDYFVSLIENLKQ